MATTPLSAAACMCRAADWQINPLDLQRVLYLAELVHVGRHGVSMLTEPFEAGLYGPTIASVFRKCRVFGARRVKNIFRSVPHIDNRVTLDHCLEATASLAGLSSGKLVSEVQGRDSAWLQYYVPRRRRVIPVAAIQAHYERRFGAEGASCA